jgi:predicted anti-sigma-YlaC factor YlaD
MRRVTTLMCERERQWISRALDGELSEFEHVIMAAHLERCADCRAYADDVRAVTTSLRSAPLEPLETPVWVGRPVGSGRAARLRLRIVPVASAAAAITAAVIGLTSVPEHRAVTDGGVRAAVPGRSFDGALVNELVLAVRRPSLAEGTQAVLPEVSGGIGAVKPPLDAVPY